MELPKPLKVAREVSSDLVLDGVRLNGDSYLAFMAIMNSWKVFGGRDVPLLLKMCTGVTTLTLRAGECLFEEGKPLERCLYILKDGELEISVQPDIGLGQPQPVYSSSGDGATTAPPLLPPDFLERIDQEGTIISGILDFVALLTESSVAEYCASARCTKDCRILQVPIIPTNGGRKSSSSIAICSGSTRIRSGSTSSNSSNGNGASPSVAEQEGDEASVPRNSASAQARCRLIRSCLIRSHRVTLATAYAYLGVIYDLYPRHPIFPVVGSALTSLTPEALLGEKHQHALKRLIRLVLALDSNHAIPDLERCVVPASSRGTPTAGGGNGGSNGVAPGAVADPRLLQRQGSGAASPSGFGGGAREDGPGAAFFPWNQPRLYLLRRGESPHELDEQSRTSLHILVTGRLHVTKVDATAAAPGGAGQAQGQQGHGRASPSGIGKSIFSDHYGAMRGPLAAAMAASPSLSLSSGSPASGAAAAAASAAAAARGEHGPGAVLGYSCLLTGAPEDWYTPRGKNRARLRLEASCELLVVQIPLVFVEKAMKPHPLATLALAARKTLETIPRVLRVIDFGVKWKQLQAGEVLVREGQPSDGCLYVLLYGRVRSSIQQRPSASASSLPPQAPSDEVEAAKLQQQQELEQKENVVVVADHGRGTLIGETEILTGGTHKVTVQAVRYTSFATIPSSVLSLLIRRHPRVLAHLAEHVVEKAAHNSRHHLSFYRDRTPMKMFTLPMPVPAGAADGRQGAGSPFWASSLASSSSPGARRVVVGEPGAKTILVLPASSGVPVDYFIKTLEGALVKARHSVRTVTSALAASVLGLDEDTYYSAAWCQDNVLLLESWLTQQEEQHEIVLYQADWEEDSEWNRMAAGMADVVLLVGNAADPPGILKLEQNLDPLIRSAQKLLILLHVNPSPYYTPSGTRLWIEKRAGIQQHYHVRMHTQSAQFDQQHIRSDFARLSRILTGTAVGLVLGGGGARGMAHLGLLRVLEEEGIPVDHIVGVSIGAFIGGLYAKHSSYLEILPFASRFAQNMSSTWLFVKDFTLPFTSYFNGYSFGRELEKAFGDTKIEDCWLSFACLTVDLSVSRERVHQNGTLWRYVRASMTLAGLLPPLCDVDPKDDAVHYLVDGGYVNNLPADVMKEVFSAETTIACDIGVEVRMTGRQDYGDTLTGLQVLLHALLPTWARGGEAATLKAPSMGEISSQLMYVRSVQQLERAKESIDCYLRPPVTHFGIMEWKRHAELQSLGYLYCRDSVRAWREALKKEKGGRGTTSAFPAVTGLGVIRGRSLSALDDYHSA